MKPGRELDAMVAEKVMGLGKLPTTVSYFPGETPSGPVYLCPFYSTDIAAAWEVVEKLRFDGFEFLIRTRKDGTYIDAEFSDDGFYASSYSSFNCEAAPHAICLAALKAIGSESLPDDN